MIQWIQVWIAACPLLPTEKRSSKNYTQEEQLQLQRGTAYHCEVATRAHTDALHATNTSHYAQNFVVTKFKKKCPGSWISWAVFLCGTLHWSQAWIVQALYPGAESCWKIHFFPSKICIFNDLTTSSLQHFIYQSGSFYLFLTKTSVKPYCKLTPSQSTTFKGIRAGDMPLSPWLDRTYKRSSCSLTAS